MWVNVWGKKGEIWVDVCEERRRDLGEGLGKEKLRFG